MLSGPSVTWFLAVQKKHILQGNEVHQAGISLVMLQQYLLASLCALILAACSLLLTHELSFLGLVRFNQVLQVLEQLQSPDPLLAPDGSLVSKSQVVK